MLKLFIWIGVFLSCCLAKPQLNQYPSLTDKVNDIFFDNKGKTKSIGRRGFDEIVTPEPFVEPTEEPQFFNTTKGEKCKCVPYYLCKPDTGIIDQSGAIDGFGKIDIRFDPTSCQDVLDVCCSEGNQVAEPINPDPVVENPNRPKGCGIRNVGGIDFELTGNNNYESGFGEFPWTVALLNSATNAYFCAGSLIHPQVVITSNHCVQRYKINEMKIRAGEWDTQTEKERLPYQERNFARILSHPNYEAALVFYNFALVILDSPLEIADHISVICLPPQNFQSTSKNCFSSGWGKNGFGLEGKYSTIMKSIPLPIVPFDECQNRLRQTRLGERFILNPSFICAGGQKGIDTCEGDGGGPLICPKEPVSENRYYLIGITSWGIGCNSVTPAAYANVAIVRDWIDQQMNSLGFDTSVYGST